jgi:YidC/Oxa1 family membrane protein insertase
LTFLEEHSLDTRRFLIAIGLSLLVMVLWGKLFPAPERQPRPQTDVGQGQQTEAGDPSAPAAAPEPIAGPGGDEPAAVAESEPVEISPGETLEEIRAEREERTVIETAEYRAELTNRGAQLVSFQLNEHRNAAGGPVDLVRAREDWPYPFGLYDGTEPSPLNDALFAVERSRDGDRQVVTFRFRGSEGEATKRFAFEEGGLFDVDIEFPDGRSRHVTLGPGIRNPSTEELESRFTRKSAVYLTADDLERLDSAGEESPTILPGSAVYWLGLQDTYFLSALIPREPLEQVTMAPVLGELAEGAEAMRFRPFPDELSDEEEGLVREMDVLVRPADGRLSATAYWGPKIYDKLEALPYGLERTVERGPFGFLGGWLFKGLQWIYNNLVSNWGWAIILMTLAIRIVLFPLNHKSVVSMQKMQEVNPKIQAIRQKYRSKLKDKQGRPNAEMQRKMNEEIMALYKQEGVNPAGGCLPLLLQIPVLFAFYSLLSTAIELRYAPWVGWIHDLSAPDPYLILPIVMGASQFLQQKMTPTAGDPMQRRIMMLLPIFFTILFLGFPSGLVLYWLTNNLLGIVQQVAYQRMKDKKAAEATA